MRSYIDCRRIVFQAIVERVTQEDMINKMSEANERWQETILSIIGV